MKKRFVAWMTAAVVWAPTVSLVVAGFFFLCGIFGGGSSGGG